MQEDIFGAVKERVSIHDICALNGIMPVRQHGNHYFTLCPFHKEKTASFAVYTETNSFYCFGCGVGGDGITLVSMLNNLSLMDAVKKINDDFHLNLLASLTQEQKKQLQKEREKRQKDNVLLTSFQYWKDQYYDTVCKRIRLLNELLHILRPKSAKDLSTGYSAIINELQIMEYHSDILLDGGIQEMLLLYMDVERGKALAEGKGYRNYPGTERQSAS